MSYGLEKYYPGDARWSAFAKHFEEEWGKCEWQDQLLDKLAGHVDLSVVVYGLFLEQALNWVEEPVPALEGLSPQKCTTTKKGILRLRTMLMRMH